jgi:hypothetical protein
MILRPEARPINTMRRFTAVTTTVDRGRGYELASGRRNGL